MKVDALIASVAGVQERRVGHARNETGRGNEAGRRSLVPDAARALVPALALLGLLALAFAALALLPAHPLVLVALWVGTTGLLIALPYATVRLAAAALVALDG